MTCRMLAHGRFFMARRLSLDLIRDQLPQAVQLRAVSRDNRLCCGEQHEQSRCNPVSNAHCSSHPACTSASSDPGHSQQLRIGLAGFKRRLVYLAKHTETLGIDPYRRLLLFAIRYCCPFSKSCNKRQTGLERPVLMTARYFQPCRSPHFNFLPGSRAPAQEHGAADQAHIDHCGEPAADCAHAELRQPGHPAVAFGKRQAVGERHKEEP